MAAAVAALLLLRPGESPAAGGAASSALLRACLGGPSDGPSPLPGGPPGGQLSSRRRLLGPADVGDDAGVQPAEARPGPAGRLGRGAARRADAAGRMAEYLGAVGAALEPLQPLGRLSAALQVRGGGGDSGAGGRLQPRRQRPQRPPGGRALLQQEAAAPPGCRPGEGPALVAPAAGAEGPGAASIIISTDAPAVTCTSPPVSGEAVVLAALASAASDIAAAGVRVQVGLGFRGF